MKWSFKDVLLIVGIMVAAIITAAAIIFKDELPRSSDTKLLPKKVASVPFSLFGKARKVIVKLPARL